MSKGMGTCGSDSIGPTCRVPMFPVKPRWTCPKCGRLWVADVFWRTK